MCIRDSHIFNAWGEVGLLINNAGVDDCGRNAGDIPIEEWEEVINTNLWGVVFGCQAFIPNMIGQGGGHIAVGTYGAGIVSAAEMAPYYIAKAAVTSYSNKLATELAPYNIGVSMLCSSMINNGLIDRWLKRIGFDLGIRQLHKA
jgi:NAD(P)-dependent dehydrogenase (short-subunit alcohol dehydrogenase family)